MNIKQLQYLEQEIAEYIATYPEEVGIWVNRLIAVVEDRQTNENMCIVDNLELADQQEWYYNEWYKELILLEPMPLQPQTLQEV